MKSSDHVIIRLIRPLISRNLSHLGEVKGCWTRSALRCLFSFVEKRTDQQPLRVGHEQTSEACKWLWTRRRPTPASIRAAELESSKVKSWRSTSVSLTRHTHLPRELMALPSCSLPEKEENNLLEVFLAAEHTPASAGSLINNEAGGAQPRKLSR